MRDMWWWFFSLWSYGVRSFFLEFRLLPLWAVLWFFKETAGSRYLQRITTRELAGSGYLKKIRISGMPGLGISKSRRTAGFHERATVLCLCFTGWSCGGSFTFWSPLVICIYNWSDLQQRTGLVSKNCPTLGYFLILDLLLYRQEILTWSVRITLHQLQKWNSLRRVTFSRHGEAFHPFRWGAQCKSCLDVSSLVQSFHWSSQLNSTAILQGILFFLLSVFVPG